MASGPPFRQPRWLVLQIAARGDRAFPRLVQQRIDARRDVARSRTDPWVEVEVEADGPALFGPETSQLAQPLPADGCRHEALLPCPRTVDSSPPFAFATGHARRRCARFARALPS